MFHAECQNFARVHVFNCLGALRLTASLGISRFNVSSFTSPPFFHSNLADVNFPHTFPIIEQCKNNLND